jgi:hypothetical protein
MKQKKNQGWRENKKQTVKRGERKKEFENLDADRYRYGRYGTVYLHLWGEGGQTKNRQ